MRARRSACGLALLALAAFAGARPAHAIDRDVRAVIVAGEYGLLGGTVLGLATLPFTESARSVFQGTSLGLYLGIAVGFYYVMHRDDAENPLRMEPDTQGQSGGGSPFGPAIELPRSVALARAVAPPPGLQFSFAF
jgi:hypothetical protein